MHIFLHYCFLLAIPSLVLLHLIAAPYTKVEESFNIQAIHDILSHGIPLKNTAARLQHDFDHATFPGAVPRTFIGALWLAELSRPLLWLVSEGLYTQILVRGVLGMMNAFALLSFYHAVKDAFGKVAGYWYIIFQATQFHVIYYASRTLPNMFAFTLSTMALRSFILSYFGPHARRAKRQRLAIYLLTIAGVIFRSELAILVVTISVSFCVVRKDSLSRVVIPAGLLATVIGLLATLLIDSFFWQQSFLWPEWAAFYFNTIQGKSSEWGTSPWHFYFSSSIPRLMLNPATLLICLPVALTGSQFRKFALGLLTPLLTFVAIFSILPHKEWRFIIYVIPGLTAIASAGASHIWTRRYRSKLHQGIALLLIASSMASLLVSIAMLLVSALNYPGALAITRLHSIASISHSSNRPVITVHLGNLACQTGITRFLQLPPEPSTRNAAAWIYDKSDPNPETSAVASMGPIYYDRFDWVLAEPDVAHELQLLGTWKRIEVIQGFAGVDVVHIEESDRGQEKQQTIETRSLRPGGVLNVILAAGTWAARLLRRHVTRGRWPAIKMESRIVILRNALRVGADGVF